VAVEEAVIRADPNRTIIPGLVADALAVEIKRTGEENVAAAAAG
jgi:hypothetical protein